MRELLRAVGWRERGSKGEEVCDGEREYEGAVTGNSSNEAHSHPRLLHGASDGGGGGERLSGRERERERELRAGFNAVLNAAAKERQWETATQLLEQVGGWMGLLRRLKKEARELAGGRLKAGWAGWWGVGRMGRQVSSLGMKKKGAVGDAF